MKDPLDMLDGWLSEVDYGDPPLMALATLGNSGQPRVRHVLLSAYDRGRLHFNTDSTSAKVAELTADPRAAVTLVWPEIPRQLVVEGRVVAETESERHVAYARRSRYLQLLAWINSPELAQAPEPERKAVWAAFDAAHPTLEPPPTWTGYALVAERITFWCATEGAPSQRLDCRRAGHSWSMQRLAG